MKSDKEGARRAGSDKDLGGPRLLSSITSASGATLPKKTSRRASDVSALSLGDFDDDGMSVGSLRSVGSEGSLASSMSVGSESVRSAFSSKIMEASRRGMERAESANKLSVRSADEREWQQRQRSMLKKDKKNKKKIKKLSRQRGQIRGIMAKSARSVNLDVSLETVHVGDSEGILKEVVEENEDGENPITSLPTTTELLTANDFKILDRVDSKLTVSTMSLDDDSVAASMKKDKRYIRKTTKSKFEKGLKCTLRKQGGPKVKLGLHRMSTHSADRLRTRYYSQNEMGEKLYGEGKYAEAIPCFNDAKFALLIIAGRPENKAQRDDPGVAMYAKLRDEINSALLSERITDCHVQDFSRKSARKEATDGVDYLDINYLQAATMVSETKKHLAHQIEDTTSAAKGGTDQEEEKISKKIEDLEELLNEANLALARIFSKQGSVCAKMRNHVMALDCFADSIAAWEEAANAEELDDRSAVITGSSADRLLLETHEVMNSLSENTRDAVCLCKADSLKQTTHLKALSAALQIASSYHALGTEAAEGGASNDQGPFVVAISHHMHALEFVRVAQGLHAASNTLSAHKGMSMDHRLTTQGRELTVLTEKIDSKDIVENIGQFMKRCTLLQAQQQLCISHACLILGHQTLSKKWLSKAISSMDELSVPEAKREAELTTLFFSMMMDDVDKSGEKKRLSNFSLYERALPAFTGCHDHEARLLLQFAMATLEKGFHQDAIEIFRKATALKSTQDPQYHDDILHAMNAQIIIEFKEGNTDEAVRGMIHRISYVGKWLGSSGAALAKDLHRLGCLYSAIGNYKKSMKSLMKSLHTGVFYDDYDALESSKLLAKTHDVLGDTDHAISEYKVALGLEKDRINKARLMNALANQQDGHEDAVKNIEESLKIQNLIENREVKDANLIFETMILYGKVMTLKNDFARAIHWYESALNSNPDKNPLHPSNLRAWYNKGVTLSRSGDMIGASNAFGTIMDEIEKNSTTAPGTIFVINAFGSILFANRDYAGAIEHFTKTLALKNVDIPLCQRAMITYNIAIANHKLHNYEESERYFNEALDILDPERCLTATSASIMCKHACLLYKRKLYLRAYNMFRDAASFCTDQSSDFVKQCDSYAELSRQNMMKQSNSHMSAPPVEKISNQTPPMGEILLPLTEYHFAHQHRDAVYSQKRIILVALGVKPADCDSIETSSEETTVLCDRALEYLLKQTEDSRTAYASDFDGLVVEKLNSKFVTIKSLLCQ